RLVVEGALLVDQHAIGGQLPVLVGLREGVFGVAVVRAEDRLVWPAEYFLRIGELQTKATGALGQAAGGVLAGRAPDELRPAPRRATAAERRPAVVAVEVTVVDVAVEGARRQVAIVGVPREQQLLRQELRGGQVDEIEQVLGDVGGGVARPAGVGGAAGGV